jgi:hypothetical protein
MSDKNAIFEEPLQAWFRALSPEERSAALTVKDGPFVSTLIHFAALSTSLNDDGKAEIDGRGECLVFGGSSTQTFSGFCADRAFGPSRSCCEVCLNLKLGISIQL